MTDETNSTANGMRMNEAEDNAGERNEGYVPKDWHARMQRSAAAENVSNLRELPMNNVTTNDVIDGLDPVDILRKVIIEFPRHRKTEVTNIK